MIELNENTECICIKCGQQLSESQISEYSFQCSECNEDFYSFEVQTSQALQPAQL